MLKLTCWSKLLFTKNLIEAMQAMESVEDKELCVIENELDIIVCTPCRTLEIRFRPYGGFGDVHTVEVHYENHKERYGTTVTHHVNNMRPIVDQLNKYFDLLTEV